MILCLKYAKRVPGAIMSRLADCRRSLCFISRETSEPLGGFPKAAYISPPKLHYDVSPAPLPAFTVHAWADRSLMSASRVDRNDKDKHNPNVELMAQGVANIVLSALRRLPQPGL